MSPRSIPAWTIALCLAATTAARASAQRNR